MSKKFIAPSLIPKLLTAFWLTLGIFHVVAVLAGTDGGGVVAEFSRNFDLDRERNVPTMYSGFLLAMCAFSSILLAARKTTWRHKLGYFFIGSFFLYIAFDETLVIHELFASPVRDLLSIEKDNALYHAWVLPAALVIGVLVSMYYVLRGKDAETTFQRKILLSLAGLGAVIVSLEIIGTQLYFSEVAYKLGPVMIEELIEIGVVSYLLSLYVKKLNSSET